MSTSSYSATSETQVMYYQKMGSHTGWVQSLVHLPGGRHIITCSEDGSLRLWDLESGTQIGNDWRDEKGKAGVLAMALSPNCKIIASGNGDKTVKLWDVETGKVMASWKEHSGAVLAVCWNPEGVRVASGSRDGTVRIWDIENGTTVVGPISTGHKTVYAVAYSPDGLKIATGGDGGSPVKLWDSKSGELLSSTGKQPESAWSLAWTSDGNNLVSGGNLRSIRIFDTATLQLEEIGLFKHANISAIALSRNDRLIASASWDRTARLWSLETNLQVGLPLRHDSEVNCVAFSADAALLVTACKDGSIYVWNIRKMLVDADAAHSTLFEDTPPEVYFDAPQDVESSATQVTQSHSPIPASSPGPLARRLFRRMSTFFRTSRNNTNKIN